MTLDEKIGQLNQLPGPSGQTGPAALAGTDQQIREGKVGSFLSYFGAEKTRRLQRIAVEESRLHVPLLFAMDVIHGWSTVFPVPLAEAAAFDTAAAEESARIAAAEAVPFGIHWTFAPMVDVARDPRWGRVVEGAGEDPFLGSALAAARVRGFQGGATPRLTDHNTLLATAKHFVGYGGAQGGRDYDTAELSERTLWETYLPPFEAAVRAGVGSIMTSFNDIGGTPSHASPWLLGDVLRGRWAFRGLVVSDWAGIEELIAHGIAADKQEAGARAIRAGVDVDMSDAVYATSLAAAVRAGTVPMAAVDSAAHRVLRLKAMLGLFDDPYRGSDSTRERTGILTPEYRRTARTIAARSIVLLRDAGVMPLAKTARSIAVIGPLADDKWAPLGSWVGAGRPEDVITPLAGIRAAVPKMRVTYVRGVPVDTPSTAGIAAAVQAARAADAVVLVLGERGDMTGEATSRATLELPGSQLALAGAVARAVRATPGKKLVAVLLNGRPLALQGLVDSVPAIVESWFLGVEHGNALADVLFGDVNPSGKLPITFPRVTGQVPIYYAHKNTGRPPSSTDHYTSKYIDVPWTPLFPFGSGLSYTTFRYANVRLSRTTLGAGDSLVVQADVTNTGKRAGDEIVQLYVRDDVASVARPVRELRGFQRVPLQPGDTKTVRFTLGMNDLAFYAADMRRVVEPGGFTVWVGGSSIDGLEGKFSVVGDTVVVAPAPPRYR